MIFVVKTSQQLLSAISKNAQEIIISGQQAAEMLTAISRKTEIEDGHSLYSIFSQLRNKFEVMELTDHSQQVEGILYRK